MGRLVAAALGIVAIHAAGAPAQAIRTVVLRGHAQTVHVYGRPGAPPVIVSSGDGGWIHLGPQVAEFLAARDCFVVGFDVKAYLESFSAGGASVRPDDEPADYKALADFASAGTSEKPILIGVSEGAGLSVLAAANPDTRRAIAGVIGLGMANLNELGWRWRDAVIYFTHGVPDEPTFSAAALVARVSPAPLAAIQSVRDEFVPLSETRHVFDSAKEPKRLWIVNASDHRFSDNRPEFEARLLDAIAWVRANRAVQRP